MEKNKNKWEYIIIIILVIIIILIYIYSKAQGNQTGEAPVNSNQQAVVENGYVPNQSLPYQGNGMAGAQIVLNQNGSINILESVFKLAPEYQKINYVIPNLNLPSWYLNLIFDKYAPDCIQCS